jgi:uncharacterized integral membrane protein (TIGR00698 family)
LPQPGDAPGIVLALAVGGAAFGLAAALPPSPLISDILIALVLGAVLLNTPLRRILGLKLPGHEREPDRYAGGLRFVGKWLLRLAIVLMGLRVQTSFFRGEELALIAGLLVAALPSAFCVAHAVGAWLGVRRPMTDLLAGGTMICGASAVNALAPVVGARREEQGVAIAAVFLFSVVALVTFRPIAYLVGLDSLHAGIWAGAAVNDLSSAIAVGKQMGEDGGLLAAAAKSARVLLLAPTLIAFAVARAHTPVVRGGLAKAVVAGVPRYLFGYVGMALFRAAWDRFAGGSAAWDAVLVVDRWAIDLLLVAVAAGVGLHLELGHLVGASLRAVAVSGAASVWMAAQALAMIAAAGRGSGAAAALVGVVGLAVALGLYRLSAGDRGVTVLERRLAAGLPLSLAEATQLLDAREAAGNDLDDALRRRLLVQLHPTIGELIPARESPLAHGDGSRWTTYWQGRSGWALVAICREPGSETPIHAHPHRLLAKTIEGAVEELQFTEDGGTAMLIGRRLLGHGELVETEGPGGVHLIRARGPRAAIDLQLRGPELGQPGRRLVIADPVDLATLPIGGRLAVRSETDDRPGHGGEGPSGGRWSFS